MTIPEFSPQDGLFGGSRGGSARVLRSKSTEIRHGLA
jgi:hypothetical protein